MGRHDAPGTRRAPRAEHRVPAAGAVSRTVARTASRTASFAAERARRYAERRVISREYDRKPRESFSESLLADLWSRTPEPDYELVKARNLPRSPLSRIAFALMAVVLGFAFTAAVLQLTRVVEGPSAEDALVSRIEDGRVENEELSAANDVRRTAIDDARANVLTDESSRSLDALTAAASIGAVSGPGVRIVLEDQRAADPGAQDTNKVQDIDLQTVTNGLFASGAEAVAVNGHRLTATSSIRSAGGAILVNYDPIGPPFTVEALGPDDLADTFGASPAASYLGLLSSEYGITSTMSPADVELPAAETSAVRYARTPDAGTSAAESTPVPTPDPDSGEDGRQ
ncbi:DUF881 domain-containing protein [Brevibacterium samyangense]|uniref:DUF881 domain-containing protein n=1 Tax=Brevibacterium samyangense TaxID=366888 RepID=A0ABN2TD99_9MICO